MTPQNKLLENNYLQVQTQRETPYIYLHTYTYYNIIRRVYTFRISSHGSVSIYISHISARRRGKT